MKKPARIACLVAALVLSSIATAGAWPWWADEGEGYCEIMCPNGMETVITYWGECCNSMNTFYCSDGSSASAWSWTNTYGVSYSCW